MREIRVPVSLVARLLFIQSNSGGKNRGARFAIGIRRDCEVW
jgi:hypothetical protein